MRAFSDLMVRANVKSHRWGNVATRGQTRATAVFDLAGLAFGLLFFVFMLVGLNAATRAAPLDAQRLASLNPFEFPDDD
jgi:hypothetical protein